MAIPGTVPVWVLYCMGTGPADSLIARLIALGRLVGHFTFFRPNKVILRS